MSAAPASATEDSRSIHSDDVPSEAEEELSPQLIVRPCAVWLSVARQGVACPSFDPQAQR